MMQCRQSELPRPSISPHACKAIAVPNELALFFAVSQSWGASKRCTLNAKATFGRGDISEILPNMIGTHLALVFGMNLGALILTLAALSASGGTCPGKGGQLVEPQIEEVQQRAIDHARLDPQEISSWKRRARLSALLPRLQLDYSRRVKNDVDIDINDSVYVGSSGVTVGPEEGKYSRYDNQDQDVGIRAVWNLNEAVFNPDVLAVSAEARRLARERQVLLGEVNRNYYDRVRLAGVAFHLKKKRARAPRLEKVRHELFLKRVACKEATAALDAMTGGWFSERLRELNRSCPGLVDVCGEV